MSTFLTAKRWLIQVFQVLLFVFILGMIVAGVTLGAIWFGGLPGT